MELYVFAANFPDLYVRLNEAVSYTIVGNNMTGDESIRDWDNMIDNIVRTFENNGQGMGTIASQQVPFGDFGWDGRDRNRDWDRDWDRDRNWDRDRDRDRNRFNDFNLRDVVRLMFLRQLFDRDRR